MACFKTRRKFIQKVRDKERRKAERLYLLKYTILGNELNKTHSREIELLNKGFKAKAKRIDRLQEKLNNLIREEERVLSFISSKHEIVTRCSEKIKSALKDHKISVALINEVEHDSDTAQAEALLAG
jgi:hypothetical protein